MQPGGVGGGELLAGCRQRRDPLQLRVLWIVGAVGIVLDLLLKLTLSPVVGRRLADATDFAAAAADEGEPCTPDASHSS